MTRYGMRFPIVGTMTINVTGSFLIGLLFTVFASIGFVFEYYRGNFSH